MKTAIVSGATGQTASYLIEILLEKGYKVYGIRRRASTFNTERIDHLYSDPHVSDRLELVYGDLADYSSISNLVSDIKPDLFFNCGAMSHVRISFDIPEYTYDVTGTGVVRCLESIKKQSPQTRFLTMSSSEMFGTSPPPQNENTPFQPCSPYAVAKITGYWSVKLYRSAYGLFATNAICFNNESPRRGGNFLTRKISRGATRIKYGLQNKLYLGNLLAKRDWGHAKDTADALYKIIMAESPSDYVVATGEMHSVQEFLELVFSKLDLDWKKYVEIDSRYFRPLEIDALCGDPTKIKTELNWEPKFSFIQLVDDMVKNDLKLAMKEKLVKESVE